MNAPVLPVNMGDHVVKQKLVSTGVIVIQDLQAQGVRQVSSLIKFIISIQL